MRLCSCARVRQTERFQQSSTKTTGSMYWTTLTKINSCASLNKIILPARAEKKFRKKQPCWIVSSYWFYYQYFNLSIVLRRIVPCTSCPLFHSLLIFVFLVHRRCEWFSSRSSIAAVSPHPHRRGRLSRLLLVTRLTVESNAKKDEPSSDDSQY